MNVLGIDPGTGCVGLALVDTTGRVRVVETIKLGAKMDSEERIHKLRGELRCFLGSSGIFGGEVLDTVAVIEGFAMYGTKASIINAFQMGRVIQAIIDLLHGSGIEVAGVVPARKARKFVTGNPSAKSSQIREGLQKMGYDQRMNDHTRDALALALYWREEGDEDNQV